jgi:sigma-B regulation protein RsbU (phosphoserine phosphatase)
MVANGRPPRVPRDVAHSLLAGVIVFLVAGGAELAAVRVLGVDARELDGVSDVILSAAFASAVFLRLRLQASRSEMSRLEREHLILDTQLAVAADIQRRILPAAPPRAGGCRWAARLRPAGRVGGDFYDFVPAGGDSLLVVVADISGKGIPAALLLAATRTLFRSLARQTRDPGEILTQLSAATYAEYDGLPYVTCIAARVDGAERRLTYANAGHPAGLLLSAGAVRTLDSGGPPLGLFPATAYASASVALQPEDVGVIVTDGITEALEAGTTAPADVLAAIAARREPAAEPESICDRIMRAAEQGAAAPSPAAPDDRTVVVFAVDGASPSR